MRKITETLRLHYECGRSQREISRAIGASPTTVGEYLRRAKAAGLSYPLPAELDETALESRLFPPPVPVDVVRAEPDWVMVHQELRKKSVTLELLWQEYKSAHPDGYRYSWFCEHYRVWAGTLSVTMRQTHTPGEKLFVDYAGQTLPVIDPASGEIRQAQLFVAVLGASNYTFAEATWTQQLPDWIGSHVRCFEFLGGVTEILVPDNLKSGVKHPSYYDPELNPTYRDLAEHYGITVLPARSRKPRDKAKVECGVLVVERWILASLRNQRFFSLAELNLAIAALLGKLNLRSFKKLPGCRHSAFLEMDRPALRALPLHRYQYAEWKRARVTGATVELLFRGNRVACHAKSSKRGAHTTIAEHMPAAHRAHLEWSPQRLLDWGRDIGPHTHRIVDYQLTSKPHPEMGYRACLGLLSLARAHGKQRLEAACARAVAIGALNRRSVINILKAGLDNKPLPSNPAELQTTQADWITPPHDNVRGPSYYH